MILWILGILILIALLPVLVIAPSARRKRADSWRGTAFAHRGLHNETVCENTLEAFERACNLGVGIELDVQLTRDGKLVVFHDADLERLMGDSRKVADLSFEELQTFHLPDGSRVPTFAEVLKLVNGRVPLLVELKNGKRLGQLCRTTLQHLKGYQGKYIVESFQPLILLWMRVHAPQVIRGQLVAAWEEYVEDYGPFLATVLTNLVCNVLARPDFVAYDLSGAMRFGLRMQKKLFNTPMAVWTVKTKMDFELAIQRKEMPIFEGFIPDKMHLNA